MPKRKNSPPLYFYGCTAVRPMNWSDMSGFVNMFVPVFTPRESYKMIVVFTRCIPFEDQKLFRLEEINEMPIRKDD